MSNAISTIHVTGMMCDACVGHVTKALQAIEGVETVVVSLNDKQAVVTYDPSRTAPGAFIGAIQEEGYEAAL